MSNPFNIYFAVKTFLNKRVNCPNCQHQLSIHNHHDIHTMTCTFCGKHLKLIAGKAYLNDGDTN